LPPYESSDSILEDSKTGAKKQEKPPKIVKNDGKTENGGTGGLSALCRAGPSGNPARGLSGKKTGLFQGF
jgi:hypothetical protein